MPDSGVVRSFELLGLSPGASGKEVKSGARKLFLKYHPDLNPGNKAVCEEKTKKIVDAYKTALEYAIKTVRPEAAGGLPFQGKDEELIVWLVFEMSNRLFAIRMDCVKEILRVKDVRIDDVGMVSSSFPFMVGGFPRGGELVMLWNLQKQFRIKETPITSAYGRTKIIVVDSDGSKVGFLVDEVRGISSFKSGEICPAGFESGIESVFMDGRAESGSETVNLINLNNVLYNQYP